MSETHDYLISPTPPGTGVRRRSIVIGAALAVVMVAGVGGALAARQLDRPRGGGTQAVAADATPTPKNPTASPSAEITAPPEPAMAATPPRVAPTFPPAVYGLDQGTRYWAVYLALRKTVSDPRVVLAQRQAGAVGYTQEVGGGDLSCDRGARELLSAAGIRLDPAIDYQTVALYFRTQQHASAFVDAYQPGVVGTVPVNAYCGD